MSAPRTAALVPIVFALAVAQAAGQETPPDPNAALQELLSSALTVSISARILPRDTQDDTPIWNAESTRLTIPGRAIRVRLDGENMRIYLICTPYVQEDGEVLLLAQGQVWFSEPTDNESKYSNTFYTIPVSFDSPVFFYPLGVAADGSPEKGFFNIEVEIRIGRYGEGQ
jgi:hypothetical protein